MTKNRRFSRWFTLASVLAVVTSCSDKGTAPVIVGSLGGDSVARIGDTAIPASLVARVAAAQHIAPRAAVLLLIDDALAAQGATASGLDRDPSARWSLVSARARVTARRLYDDAHSAGPPNDSELAELTARRWREFDLPDQIRVVHAVAQRPPKPNAAVEAKARTVASEIARAVASATTADDFMARAKAVSTDGVTVTVQPIPAFVPDGRTMEDEGNLDASFAAAAFALPSPGSTSAVVETKYGWHVIRLVERLPGKHVPVEERRATLTPDAYSMRGYKALEASLAVLRKDYPVDISTAAEALMAEAATQVFSARTSDAQ